MRFTEPLYLLLLIPVAVGLALSYRYVHGMAKGRKRLTFVLRFLLAGAVVLALSGLEARRPNQGICTIFLLDHSDSIGDKDRKSSEQFVDAAVKRLDNQDMAGVIVFGRDAVIDTAPSRRVELGRVLSQVDGSATDLAGAIRLASASFPDGKAKRIVVLSDGDETDGDASEAAEVAATDGIDIDHVVLGLGERSGEASVAEMDVPSEVRSDQPFDIHVQVDSTIQQNGMLDIDRDGVMIKQAPVRLTSGRTSIVVSDKVSDTGFHRYRATLRADHDLDSRNNIGMGFVAVRGKPRILILQQDPTKRTLADALKKNGVQADVVGPIGIPTKAEELQVYDAILLNDINADAFRTDQMKLFQSAVRDSGIGLAMIGGENSFLPGGYYGTPIADALPVDLNIRQRKSFPSISVAIMIDASGSMGMMEDGVMKIRLAGKAAEETVKLLSPMDRCGVAGSTDGIDFVAPMQQLTDKEKVIQQIRNLYVGGGGIYAEPSMAEGERVMMKETTQVRHFILMADGNDVDTQEGCLEIASRMRRNHITTTVVAVGDGKDVGFLKTLAAAGGGRFYLADKASKLPAITTQDTSLVARSAIEEGAFIPKMVAGQEILRGIEDQGVPPLLAYCLTDSRPLTRVSMRTAKDDPLLATWQYGLGSALAFTSDAQPRWASRWVSWPGFGAFWSQAVREISRRTTSNNYKVSVHQEGSKGQIDVRALDRLGNPLTASNATIRVAAPDGAFKDVSLEEQAPGHYTGSFECGAIGTYIVTVAEPDPGGGQRISATGFSVPYPPEYRTYRPNRPLLARLSKITGGREITTPVAALRPAPNPGASITELWRLLLLFATLLLPVDIGVRRLALPMAELWAKAIGWLRSRRRAAPAPTQQQVVVGRLHQARQRAKLDAAPSTPAPVIKPASSEKSASPKPSGPKSAPEKTSSAPASTAQSLLEAKRRRDQR